MKDRQLERWKLGESVHRMKWQKKRSVYLPLSSPVGLCITVQVCLFVCIRVCVCLSVCLPPGMRRSNAFDKEHNQCDSLVRVSSTQ